MCVPPRLCCCRRPASQALLCGRCRCHRPASQALLRGRSCALCDGPLSQDASMHSRPSTPPMENSTAQTQQECCGQLIPGQRGGPARATRWMPPSLASSWPFQRGSCLNVGSVQYFFNQNRRHGPNVDDHGQIILFWKQLKKELFLTFLGNKIFYDANCNFMTPKKFHDANYNFMTQITIS